MRALNRRLHAHFNKFTLYPTRTHGALIFFVFAAVYHGTAMAASAVRNARKIICTELGVNFRTCTSIVPVPPPPSPLKKGTIAVRTTHVACNASDINFTSGTVWMQSLHSDRT